MQNRESRQLLQAMMALGKIGHVATDMLAANEPPHIRMPRLPEFMIEYLHVISRNARNHNDARSSAPVDAIVVHRDEVAFGKSPKRENVLLRDTLPVMIERLDTDPRPSLVVANSENRRTYARIEGGHYRLYDENPEILVGRNRRMALAEMTLPTTPIHEYSEEIQEHRRHEIGRTFATDRDEAEAHARTEAAMMFSSPAGTWIRCGMPVWKVSRAKDGAVELRVVELERPWGEIFPIRSDKFDMPAPGFISDHIKFVDLAELNTTPTDLLRSMEGIARKMGLKLGETSGMKEDEIADTLWETVKLKENVEDKKLAGLMGKVNACLARWKVWKEFLPDEQVDDPGLTSM
jgi:hypothetical protein